MRIPKNIDDIDSDSLNRFLHDTIAYVCMDDNCEFHDSIDRIIYKLIDFKYLYGPIEECLTLTIECECSFCGWNDTYYNENFYLDSKYSANKELFDILTIRELPFKIKTIVR